MLKDLKKSIKKKVDEDRTFVRKIPTLFYAKVNDFRFDLFRSSNLFALSTAVDDESATPDLTGETEEEKLYRENNEMHERLNAIFSF